MEAEIDPIVTRAWRQYVFGNDERIDRKERAGQDYPDRIAHISNDRILTYAELAEKSDAVARHLAENLMDNRLPGGRLITVTDAALLAHALGFDAREYFERRKSAEASATRRLLVGLSFVRTPVITMPDCCGQI